MDQVISNILKKAELMANGDPKHTEIRTGLIVPGGGNLCIVGAAQCMALQAMGLMDAFDSMAGISGGGFVCAYSQAGVKQLRMATSVFPNEFSSDEFIRLRNFPRILNAEVIHRVVQSGRSKLDIDALMNSRQRFYVGVTDLEGNGKFIDAKRTRSGVISALCASSATPIGFDPVEIDGEKYLDGGIGFPLPIAKVIEEFRPTDLLVLPNLPENSRQTPSLMEKILVHHLDIPVTIKQKILERHAKFHEEVLRAKSMANVHILWPPDVGLNSPLTRNPELLRRAARESAIETLSVFGKTDTYIEFY